MDGVSSYMPNFHLDFTDLGHLWRQRDISMPMKIESAKDVCDVLRLQYTVGERRYAKTFGVWTILSSQNWQNTKEGCE